MGDASFHLNVDEDMGWEGARITITFSDGLLVTKTSLLGRHNLYNILAASSLAYSVGVDKERMGKAIENFTSFDKRLRPIVTKRGLTIIDDTYNANPTSMEWAIKTLIELPSAGKRIAIIGDMRELGEKSKEYHRELGRFLKATDVPVIVLIGQEVEETYRELGKERARFFEDKGSLITYINGQVGNGDTLLVKGSRASKMEEIVEALM
jgi:UDP-N-acetylmuramoyl-tripeptide--D-alanyl-D-alanine ligase